MSDTFLPGSGFDTYEQQDKVLVGLCGGTGCKAAVRILQQQGFAVMGAVVRLCTDDPVVDAAKEAAKALGIECITLNASEPPCHRKRWPGSSCPWAISAPRMWLRWQQNKKKNKRDAPRSLNRFQEGGVHLFLLCFISSYNAQWKSSAYFAKIWIQLWPH